MGDVTFQKTGSTNDAVVETKGQPKAIKYPHKSVLAKVPDEEHPGCEVVLTEEKSNPVREKVVWNQVQTQFGFKRKNSTETTTVHVRTIQQLVCRDGSQNGDIQIVEEHKQGTERYLESGRAEAKTGDKVVKVSGIVGRTATGIGAQAAGGFVGGVIEGEVERRLHLGQKGGELAGRLGYLALRKIFPPRSKEVGRKEFNTEKKVDPRSSSSITFDIETPPLDVKSGEENK